MVHDTTEKSFIVSWDQLHRDARALAWRLEGMQQSGQIWKRIVAVTRGGMVPAMIVARELDIRVVDSISVRSYDEQTQSDPVVIKESVLKDSKSTLVVDDLVDTGRTLETIRTLLPTAHYATIYGKPKGCPVVDTFITEVSQDTWIYFPWDTALQYIGPVRSGA